MTRPNAPQLPKRSICMIRHGETTANRDGLVAGRWDVPLTETGRAQARALQAVQWAQEVAIFASPMNRADETASLIFPGQAFQTIPELSERDWGIYERGPLADLPPRSQTPVDGEAWDEMIARVQTGICIACDIAGTALPVLVCHSGVIRAARILAGQDTPGARPANATPILFHWTGTTHEERPYA